MDSQVGPADETVLDLVEDVVRRTIYREWDAAGYSGWDTAAAAVDAGKRARTAMQERLARITDPQGGGGRGHDVAIMKAVDPGHARISPLENHGR